MRNNFRLMLLSMATLGFFSCSDKLTDDNTTGGGDIGEEGYVAFTISNIGSTTRAAGDNGETDDKFAVGSDDEHAVTSMAGANVVYFFDASGNQVAFSALEVLGHPEDAEEGEPGKPGTGHESNHEGSNKERIYQARIKPDNVNDIAKCLLILNAQPITLSKFTDLSLEKMKAKIDETNADMGWMDVNNTKFFTMTNTVYVDNNKIQTETEVVPTKHIRPTMAEAQENPIVVHVERVMAKYSLGAKNVVDESDVDNKRDVEEIKPTDLDNGVFILPTRDEAKYGEETDENKVNKDNTSITICWGEKPAGDPTPGIHAKEWKTKNVDWKVKIVGWGINATETKTYWFKNLSNDDYPLDLTDLKFGYWSKNLASVNGTYYSGWNDTDRLRSYWAIDPHYNGVRSNDVYPHQYRDANGLVAGNNGINNGDGNELQSGLALNYRSYEALKANPTDDGNSNGIYRYSVENTFGQYHWFEENKESTIYQFKGNDYKRTATHVIIAAELYAQSKDDENFTNRTLYQYDSYYWEAKNETKPANYTAGYDMSNDLKEYMLEKVIFNWTIKHQYNGLYKDKELKDALTSTIEDFEEYFKLTSATVDGGDGRVMMELKPDVELYAKIVQDNGKEDAQPITKDNYNDRYLELKNEYLYEYGTARRFEGGKMYYYAPIKHMAPDNITPDNKNPNPYLYNVGTWGVVRNHWYKVNISEIKYPGLPVDDPDQPIIPRDDPDEDLYAAFEIVILPWHVINNSVEF